MRILIYNLVFFIYLYVLIIIISDGIDIIVPNIPNSLVPMYIVKMLSIGCTLFDFLYTNGLTMYPSKIVNTSIPIIVLMKSL